MRSLTSFLLEERASEVLTLPQEALKIGIIHQVIVKNVKNFQEK